MSMGKTLEERKQDYTTYLSTLFNPEDIIEFRLIHRDARDNKRIESYWTTAADALNLNSDTPIYRLKDGKVVSGIVNIFEFLDRKNKEGLFNIYVGINPRLDYGLKNDDSIKSFKTVYADLDGEQANRKFLDLINSGSLLEPTFITSSGNGFRPYYILSENITAAQFRTLQKAIAAHLGGDTSIQNPERVDRVSGFLNHKKDKLTTLAYIYNQPTELKYTAEQIAEYFKSESLQIAPTLNSPENLNTPEPANNQAIKVGKWSFGTDIKDGTKHNTLLSIACHYQKLGLSQAETKDILLNVVAPYLKNSDGTQYIISDGEAEYYANEYNRYKAQDTYAELYNQFADFREFPIDIFSIEIQTALNHYVKKYNCAPDYIYNAFLTGVAMANGTKAVIIARGRTADGKLWLISVGSSASGKSEGAKSIFVYYRILDDSAKIEYEEKWQVYLKDKTIYDAKLSTLKRTSKDGLNLKDIPDKPEEPERQEYIFGDGTLEAMNRIINNTSDGTLLYIDDFFGWYSQLCKFNNATAASNLAALQKYYDNEFYETVKQSRAKEENSLNITKHYLNIYGNIQPEIIERSLFNPDLRDSGFIHRLLFFYPDDTDYQTPPKEAYKVPKKHSDYITKLFTTLRNKQYEVTENWNSDFLTVNLDDQSDEVKDLYYKYYCMLDAIEQNKAFNNIIRSNIGRHKKHLSKLILNLHLLDCINSPYTNTIKVETVRNAFKLTRYYIAHFLKLYNCFFTGKKIADTSMVNYYDKIYDSVKNGKTTVRDIQNVLRISPEIIRENLELLERNGLGACVTSDKGTNKGKISAFRLSA